MNTKVKTQQAVKNLNKPVYAIFLATGIIFLLLKDFSQASIFWGLALVFDPFNIDQPFQKRPVYQKVWLIVHLFITLASFILMLVAK